MEHPFIEDLSDLSLEELNDKISSLTNKLYYFHNLHRPDLINQVNMMLESYNQARNKKLDEQFQKMGIDTGVKIDDNR